MQNPLRFLIVAVALCAAVSGYAQSIPSAGVLNLRPGAKFDLSKLPASLQAQVQQWRDNASTLRADIQALRQKFESMTAAERKQAWETFRSTHADLIASQRDLAKEIRTQMKALREQKTASAG